MPEPDFDVGVEFFNSLLTLLLQMKRSFIISPSHNGPSFSREEKES